GFNPKNKSNRRSFGRHIATCSGSRLLTALVIMRKVPTLLRGRVWSRIFCPQQNSATPPRWFRLLAKHRSGLQVPRQERAGALLPQKLLRNLLRGRVWSRIFCPQQNSATPPRWFRLLAKHRSGLQVPREERAGALLPQKLLRNLLR